MAQVIRRGPGGTIISISGQGAGGGSGKNSPLKQFASVIQGFSDPKDVSKDAQKALAKLDVSGIKFKDLAKFGLDKSLTKDQFKEFKGLLKDAQATNGKVDKVSKKEIKDLAKFGQGAVVDAKLDDIQKDVDELVPKPSSETIQRGSLARLDMSLFARRAVDRARGVRGAVSTSVRGDSGYGRSLARISLGAM